MAACILTSNKLNGLETMPKCLIKRWRKLIKSQLKSCSVELLQNVEDFSNLDLIIPQVSQKLVIEKPTVEKSTSSVKRGRRRKINKQ